MSIIYSHISDKYLDMDAMEAVELSNGDYVAMSDDYHLLIAYEQGLLSDAEMNQLGFDESEFRGVSI